MNNKKRLTGVWLTEHQLDLIRKEGVLTAGQNSAFSQWVGNKIEEEFGNIELNKKKIQFELDQIKNTLKTKEDEMKKVEDKEKEIEVLKIKLPDYSQEEIEFFIQERDKKKWLESKDRIYPIKQAIDIYNLRFDKVISSEELFNILNSLEY
jgi:Skp family chaperone for outer membrane proteins